jgi:hypothetical protein
MYILNFYAAWVGILFGFIAGAILGLFFHDDAWMGGYSSWQRRMARLGHISFFGLAIINLLYALSIAVFGMQIDSPYPSYLFIAGAVTMPLICFLSAYRKNFRHLFPVPVFCLITGAIIFFLKGVTP